MDEEKEGDGRRWLLGLDWGSAEHRALLMDEGGKVLGSRRVAHTGEALGQLCDWVLKASGAEPQQVHVAIETPHGPVVEHLLERGLGVFAINPKQSDRFRDRYSPAGAKDDGRDAEVLASALRTDPQAFRKVQPAPARLVELKAWRRIHEELTGDRTRQTNQVREQLWRYYPQMIEIADGQVGDAWVAELWALAPTPDKGARLRASTVAALLKRRHIRRTTAQQVIARLRATPISVAAGTAQAAQAHLRLLFQKLAMTNVQLRSADAMIDRLVAELEGEEGEAQPGQPQGQRDVEILSSLPGMGRINHATLLTEAWEPLQRRDYHALRCLCGVAPVTKRSGKSKLVVRRQAANRPLANAGYHWARCSIQTDPYCRDKYKALRSRGHSHPRALRAVTDRLLSIACAMLTTQTDYDPARAGRVQTPPKPT